MDEVKFHVARRRSPVTNSSDQIINAAELPHKAGALLMENNSQHSKGFADPRKLKPY